MSLLQNTALRWYLKEYEKGNREITERSLQKREGMGVLSQIFSTKRKFRINHWSKEKSGNFIDHFWAVIMVEISALLIRRSAIFEPKEKFKLIGIFPPRQENSYVNNHSK